MQCPSKRTLSYIIGGLNVFFSALLTVRTFVELFVISHEESEASDDDVIEEAIFRWSLDKLVTVLFCAIVWLIFSILLVKGIYEERYQLMSCWIYMNYILLTVIFGASAIGFISTLYHWQSFTDVILKLMLYTFISGFSFGAFYPIFSLYRSMQLPSLPSEHLPLKQCVPVVTMGFDVRNDELNMKSEN